MSSRMAVGFTTPSSQHEDPVETIINPEFDHLVACALRNIRSNGLYYPRAVAIDPLTNNIYVAQGAVVRRSFARVSVFSESGSYLKSCTDKQMSSLCGIAIHGNNLYVTDWELHAVFKLKIEADILIVGRIGNLGSAIGQFDVPRQLSIKSNGDLYVADSNNDRIQVLNSSLHPIREVTHPSLHKPYDIKLTIEEVYVLSQIDSPCVHIFTHTGLKTRSLITRGDGMQLHSPLSFCLNTKKCLFISDAADHKIKIFSNDAVLIHTLGERGEDQIEKFLYPKGLALISNHRLVIVSDSIFYGLQIFSFL